MKAISASIVILAGAVLLGAGEVSNKFTGSETKGMGLFVIAVGAATWVWYLKKGE